MVKYYDITPLISGETAVFPGDVPFQREIAMDMARGDHLTLSSIKTTLHLGAHTDGVNHYKKNGAGIGARALDFYLGDCQVIEVRLPRGQRIRREHMSHTKITTKRVIFKTGSFPDPNSWNGDFNSLSSELVGELASHGVILVGIDTPSIDLADDKILESHQAVSTHDMAILEGVVLSEVPGGIYTLIALPLRIADADASPVRAILIDDNGRAFRGSN